MLCSASLYALALGIPSLTPASAIASININTYAGDDPHRAIKAWKSFSSNNSYLPK